MNKSDSPTLLKYFVYSVWGIGAFYTAIYLYLGAYYSVIAVGLGTVIFSPITIALIMRKNYQLAKVFFIVCCNFYIFWSSFCSGHSIHSEYFSIPAIFVVLLLNDLENKKTVIMGVMLPLISWAVVGFFPVEHSLDKAVFSPILQEMFISINFVTSFLLSVLFLLIFVKLIREQKLMLIASEKMSTLGEMAGGVAHEINNPLTIIFGTVSLMKRRLLNNDQDLETFKSDLDKIESTTLRISKIVKGLKMFSRDSSDDPFSVNSLEAIIKNTIELCSERCKIQSINLRLNLPAAEILVSCRPSQLSQVILNLINNSVDAIEGKEDKWIEISVALMDPQVEISVTDSGNGIPKYIVEKMMQPFYSTKPIGKGTGLGLSISKGLVEAHKGQLIYDSESKNTRFIIELPISIPNQKRAG